MKNAKFLKTKHALASILIGAAILSLPTTAGAVLVDFDDVVFSGTNEIVTSTTSDGFTFTSGHHHAINDPGHSGVAANGTQYILEEGGDLGLPITMALSGGGIFSLGSFDAAEVFVNNNASYPNASVINVLGNLLGGGTVSASFSLDGILDGLGGVADFQTFVLPATFANLTSVVFSGSIPGGSTNAGISIDNLNTEAAQVPEPGTLGLLALMLAGLTLWSRKTVPLKRPQMQS